MSRYITETTKYTKYSKEQLIAILKDWQIKNGRQPTKKLFDDDKNAPGHYVVVKHFGTWSNGLSAAGMDTTPFIPVGMRKGIRHKIRKRVFHNGYYLAYEPTHPMAMKNGYVSEHRMIAYDKGMLKNRSDEVHHLNDIKSDNTETNFKILTKSEHASLTNTGRSLSDKYPKCKFCDKRTRGKFQLCEKHYKFRLPKYKECM